MKRYIVCSLDVWGNAKDGYEVNAAYTTSKRVEIGKDMSDTEIIKALKDQGVLAKYTQTRHIEIVGESGYHSLYVYRKSDGLPLINLEPLEYNS
jgi:hypothetical protein